MLEQVSGIDDQGKIDRWMGWIAAKAHSLGVIDAGSDMLDDLRSLARIDLHPGQP
jgi:hypothetical protein